MVRIALRGAAADREMDRMVSEKAQAALEAEFAAFMRWLDAHPEKMRKRRETVEHPFGARIGGTHFRMKTLFGVATEMALHVLAYNLTRAINIFGTGALIAAMRA